DVGFHNAARALDIDVVEAVDHDVADGGILQQRFERAESEDFIENLLGEPLPFPHGHGDRFVEDEPLDGRADLSADALLVEVLELVGSQRVQELVMNLALDFEPAVYARTGTDEWPATHAAPHP